MNYRSIGYFRVLFLLSGCVFLLQIVSAKEPIFPPAELKAEWATLEKNGFNNWKNIKYTGGGQAADGGSDVFEFKLEDGTEFEVVVASRNYWTEEDKAKMRQVIYVIRAERFYLLNPASDEEKLLIKMIKEAKIDEKLDAKINRELLNKLCTTIETRKNVLWLEPEA